MLQVWIFVLLAQSLDIYCSKRLQHVIDFTYKYNLAGVLDLLHNGTLEWIMMFNCNSFVGSCSFNLSHPNRLFRMLPMYYMKS